MSLAPNKVTMEAALDELEREQQVRSRCYGRWIEEKRISKTDAHDRGTRLDAAIFYLKEYLDRQIPEE
jgi:hypothetical protein